MGDRLTKNTKCCATCQNWAGPRELSYTKTWVDIDSAMDRGKCYAGVYSSVTDGQSALEGRSCPRYQPWGAFR